MRAIVCLKGSSASGEAIKNFVNSHGIEMVFALYLEENGTDGFMVEPKEKFDWRKMYYGYEGKLDCNDLTPLDGEFFEKIQPYMLNCIKMMERLNFGILSFEERMDLFFTHAEYWNHIIKAYKIDIYIMSTIPHEVYDYIIYALCKINNVKVIFSYGNNLYNYSYPMIDITQHCMELESHYKELLIKYKDTDIDDIILPSLYNDEYLMQTGVDSDKTPFYMKPEENHNVVQADNGFLLRILTRGKNAYNIIFKKNCLSNIKNWIKSWKSYRKIKRDMGAIEKNKNRYLKYWDSHVSEIDLQNEKFIYFALHLQPELTTVPLGNVFSWQMLAIKMISACLPDGYYIYVKENPKQTFKCRSLEFVDRLSQLKNVKLVARNTDTFSLIDKSIAIGTINGTVIWEGVFKNKPAIMFGDFYYRHLPGVFKVFTNKECQEAIDKIINNEINIDLKDLKIFTLALSELCLDDAENSVPHLYSQYTQEQRIENFYRIIEAAYNM